MKPRPWLIWVAGMAGAIFLFCFFAFFFIPDQVLQGLTARLVEQQGCSLKAVQFGKAFPLGVRARDLEIFGPKGLLLRAKEAQMNIRLVPLLRGKVSLTFQAAIGPGRIQGVLSPWGGEGHFEAKEVRLGDIPFFLTVTGARVTGVLGLNGQFKGKGKEAEEEIRLEVKGANIAGLRIGNIALPDVEDMAIRVRARGKGGGIRLISFTLQGRGLYARIKGEFPLTTPMGLAPLNLTLELMPTPEFLERQKFIFLLLAKYLSAPGYYLIPIRGTLANPSII